MYRNVEARRSRDFEETLKTLENKLKIAEETIDVCFGIFLVKPFNGLPSVIDFFFF